VPNTVACLTGWILINTGWLIMSIAWDVSEPRPPTPGWCVNVESHGDGNAGRGKLLTRPLELSGNPTSRDIWERVEGMDEGVRTSGISIFDTSTDL
jgi:hypothetical protein